MTGKKVQGTQSIYLSGFFIILHPSFFISSIMKYPGKYRLFNKPKKM